MVRGALSRAATLIVGPGGLTCPVFTIQLVVSMTGLVLSTGMLMAGRDPAVYLPVLTSIIGYWLPAPQRLPVVPRMPVRGTPARPTLEDDDEENEIVVVPRRSPTPPGEAAGEAADRS